MLVLRASTQVIVMKMNYVLITNAVLIALRTNACGTDDVCDPATNTCVDCLQDQDCELAAFAKIMRVLKAVVPTAIVRAISCVLIAAVSRVIADTDCPLETFCYENQCTPGCNDDDTRCPEGETCERNLSVRMLL